MARRSIAPAIGVALSLAVWAGAAWLGRVPWPLASQLTLGRDEVWWFAPPAPFVWGLLAEAAVVLALSPWLARFLPTHPQTFASRLGYPCFVCLTGLGFLLLLDLSANGYIGNRYLALYHQGHLWFGMLIMSVLVFLRQPIGHALAWSLSIGETIGSALRRRVGSVRASLAFVVAALAIVATVGLLLANKRQLTSEMGRLWLIVGAAWFFFMRGTPFAERLATSGSSIASLARYAMPIAFVVLVLVGAMFVTHDMGPLLIAGYAAGAFLAATVAMWMHARFRTTIPAYLSAILLFVLWIAMITTALFKVGAVDETTAGRLENLAAPLASANDQLALVTWFQEVTPQEGFGLGTIPWCGYGGSPTACPGIPAQVQSDYTFTALVGAFGTIAAWTLTILCALWLHRLVRHHGHVSRGEPRFVARSGRIVSDEQALLSWVALAWVVVSLCQLAVTVAGNLAVIPLTGVTFPFVSFGMTSLVINAAFLALAININVGGGE